MSTDSVGASLFEVFFANWTEEVAAARFPANLVPLWLEPQVDCRRNF
ncbi:MAG: hypothetical protein Ct9H300mP19_13070 [Dehalococcoidia bacterium]|nr:MAG: hypothetical protein Ct9H300mP19_13070 [Dehalococcoidia bacterium]